jgi:hypothetical protein
MHGANMKRVPGIFLESKGGRGDNLTTFICQIFWKSGSLEPLEASKECFNFLRYITQYPLM